MFPLHEGVFIGGLQFTVFRGLSNCSGGGRGSGGGGGGGGGWGNSETEPGIQEPIGFSLPIVRQKMTLFCLPPPIEVVAVWFFLSIDLLITSLVDTTFPHLAFLETKLRSPCLCLVYQMSLLEVDVLGSGLQRALSGQSCSGGGGGL